MNTRVSRLALIMCACAAGSYLATYAVQRQDHSRADGAPSAAGQSLTEWLRLTPEAAAGVRDIETRFAAERGALEQRLAAERYELAKLLEDRNAGDSAILKQVEAVIAANNALERCVASNLIALRPHLSGEQQKRLFDRFAGSVREGGGYRWRYGQPGGGDGERRGGGPPAGRGAGRGRGGGHEVGQEPGARAATRPQGVQR